MEPDLIPDSETDLGISKIKNRLICLRPSDQVKELQTVLRDKDTHEIQQFNGQPVYEIQTGEIDFDRTTSRSDFMFYAARLIRLVVEEGLNQLPYTECEITTPTGYKYKGLQFQKGNCGVSIMRSGEVMEQGLRDCCRTIRIGKILVQTDEETNEAKVFYAKLPSDIAKRKVLLMYPVMSSGNTVLEAVSVLKEHGVKEENVILLNLFTTPTAAHAVISAFPNLTVLTSEVHPVAPNHFGQKYFGTD